jgi:hypothetical protein
MSTDGGRIVPVYAVTGGRTHSSGPDLPLECLVTATDRAADLGDCQPEYRVIVRMAEKPLTLIEIGAGLGVPVGVARVLVGDLADAGYLTVHSAPAAPDGRPNPELLERLLDGLLAP